MPHEPIQLVYMYTETWTKQYDNNVFKAKSGLLPLLGRPTIKGQQENVL